MLLPATLNLSSLSALFRLSRRSTSVLAALRAGEEPPLGGEELTLGALVALDLDVWGGLA